VAHPPEIIIISGVLTKLNMKKNHAGDVLVTAIVGRWAYKHTTSIPKGRSWLDDSRKMVFFSNVIYSIQKRMGCLILTGLQPQCYRAWWRGAFFCLFFDIYLIESKTKYCQSYFLLRSRTMIRKMFKKIIKLITRRGEIGLGGESSRIRFRLSSHAFPKS